MVLEVFVRTLFLYFVLLCVKGLSVCVLVFLCCVCRLGVVVVVVLVLWSNVFVVCTKHLIRRNKLC